jgi:hypothetical protein
LTWGWRIVVLVALLAAFGYEVAPLWSAGFVYEDAQWNAACIGAIPMTVRAIPRRLTITAWCAQMGQSPRAYHAANVALHLLVGLFVAAVVAQVTRAEAATWAAVVLWLLHPLNMETIAYVSTRGEAIAALGVLGACLLALRGHPWLAAVAAVGGVMGKESAIAVVALVPLVLWMRDGRKTCHVAAGVALLVLLTLGASWLLALTSSLSVSLSWALLQASAAARLICLAVVPWGQTIDYDYERVLTLLKLAAAGALVAFAWSAYRIGAKAPLLAGGMGWMLVALAPRFLVATPRSVLNEHQFYLPLIGGAFVVAGLLTHTERIYGSHTALA